MENLSIRCKVCNRELQGNNKRVITCGCSNSTTIEYGNKITALDLSQVIITSNIKNKKSNTVLTNEDIAWQEARKNRKVKRLDFEIR